MLLNQWGIFNFSLMQTVNHPAALGLPNGNWKSVHFSSVEAEGPRDYSRHTPRFVHNSVGRRHGLLCTLVLGRGPFYSGCCLCVTQPSTCLFLLEVLAPSCASGQHYSLCSPPVSNHSLAAVPLSLLALWCPWAFYQWCPLSLQKCAAEPLIL